MKFNSVLFKFPPWVYQLNFCKIPPCDFANPNAFTDLIKHVLILDEKFVYSEVWNQKSLSFQFLLYFYRYETQSGEIAFHPRLV